MAAASVPALTARQAEFIETARRPGSYPHQRTIESVEDLQSLQVVARGFSWDFKWATDPRDRFFEERLEELTCGLLQQLSSRDKWGAYAFGRLEMLRAQRLPLDATTWEALLCFDHLVKITETVIAAHALLSRSTEVGTFGIPRPKTRATLLASLVQKGENSDFVSTRVVYNIALEVFDNASK